jgi:hypothetical protein
VSAESIANPNCLADTDGNADTNGNNNAQDNRHASNDSNSAPAGSVGFCRVVAAFLRNLRQQFASFPASVVLV